MILIPAILFLVLRLGESAGILPVWAASWGDDFVCLPLILGSTLLAHRHLAGRGPGYRLPMSHGLAVLILIGVFFEALLPHLRNTAVADPLDLVAYTLGFLFFQLGMNRPAFSLRAGTGF